MINRLNWEKLGIIFVPDNTLKWSNTHAIVPTPILLGDNLIRIYYTSKDISGIGRVSFFDISPDNPRKILYRHNYPVLDIGQPGSFDENGVMACSIIKLTEQIFYMYYVGFELGHKIRYKLFTGLAISENGGISFKRYQKTPILDRRV